MSRAEEFVALYNELDDFLRKQLSARGERVDASDPFTSIVMRAGRINSAVRASEYDLKAMSDLRNAIVHRYRSYIISEPRSEVVSELRTLVEKVTRPKRAENISSRNVRLFRGDEELGDVLTHMKEHQYSQVVVWESDKVRLLSSVGIARWLEHQGPETIVELKGVTLSAVLDHEPQGSFQIVARTRLADEIREMFLAPPPRTTERLQAVVVTDSGKKDQKPVGIITPWDIVA